MQSDIYASSTRSDRKQAFNHWPAVFIALCALPVAIFLLLPWSIEGKSLAVLHGLCAQQPGHSLYFGDGRLPFDARMTGIYGGFAVSSLYLLSRRRWGQGGLPSWQIGTVLLLFVAALGVDGINSTLLDMGLWHLYTPMNELRLVTGLLTGLALATFVWLLVGQVSLRQSERTLGPVITGMHDIGAILLLFALYSGIVLTAWEPLRIPLTALLIASAVAVLTGLGLAFVLLIGKRENQAASTRQLAGPATAALLIAFAVMALTSGGRFLLEAAYGISTTAV
jgi:uncharacterized membrane protein